MKTLVIILTISTIIFISCNQEKGYVITGELSGFPDSTMFYLRNLSTDEVFDSALLVGNEFMFKGRLEDTPEQMWLHTKVGEKFIYTNLLIGNEKITVQADIEDFPYDVDFKGSKTQDEFNYLRSLTSSFHVKRDSLVHVFFALPDDQKENRSKEIWSDIAVIDNMVDSIDIEYIKYHPNTYTGVIYLGYLKETIPKDTVLALYNRLSDEIRNSKYARIIEVFLNSKVSEIGDTFHDFEAFNKDGDLVKFSSLTGKYVLLDFTAAYCGPCMQSAKELRMIDKTYSDSLVIVSFSGDAKKENWLHSLERDTVTWVSLWDGKGSYSETAIKYGVNGFPQFFLINPEGIIIDTWGGYGEGSLEEKLERFKNYRRNKY